MQGLTRRWIFRDPAATAEMDRLPLPKRILHARGLRDPHVLRQFCEPKLTDLYDPELMPGLEMAATRLVAAVRRGESIAIYGDYDVDGITACAIVYHTVKAVAPESDIRIYIPHRIDEGYGLNGDALRHLRAGGVDLVVSVDCGITAIEPARVARSIGLDLIITDHHNLPASDGAIPEALAVVHPRLPGSEYPFGELCGAGIAFKLAWRFATIWSGSRRVGSSLQQMLLNLLPLAALGTIADMVPLVGENRTIATFGLRWIRQTPLVGLRALIEEADLMDADIDSEKVGFILAPRLNACGRMGHAAEAVHMLTAASPAKARAIAGRLTALNRERQQTERSVAEHAAELATDAGMTKDDRRAIVLAHESWHTGVLGIACTRLCERFSRPVILLRQQGDLCKGSARSIKGYSIYDALRACSSRLQSFGGHDAAAGLSLATTDLPAFVEALIAHANAHLSLRQLTPTALIDCNAAIGELDFDSVRQIRALAPFGRDNPRPMLRLPDATLADPPRPVGAQGRHLIMNLRSGEPAPHRWLRSVWFNAGALAATLAPGMQLEALVEPKINTYKGRTSVEAELRDVKLPGQ